MISWAIALLIGKTGLECQIGVDYGPSFVSETVPTPPTSISSGRGPQVCKRFKAPIESDHILKKEICKTGEENKNVKS
jgi:hypothetical protein